MKIEGVRVPEGWRLEAIPHDDHQMLLSMPPSVLMVLMVTIDFERRGFRSGYSQHGKFVGEKWSKRRGNTTRKQYGGRGWKQALVDDAVAYLKEVAK